MQISAPRLVLYTISTPKLVMYSQRGNTLFPTWECNVPNVGISLFLIPITGCLCSPKVEFVVLKISRGLVED